MLLLRKINEPLVLSTGTQELRAERVGIDRSFLADVERGKRNVSILNLELIAKAFRVSLSQLFSKL